MFADVEFDFAAIAFEEFRNSANLCIVANDRVVDASITKVRGYVRLGDRYRNGFSLIARVQHMADFAFNQFINSDGALGHLSRWVNMPLKIRRDKLDFKAFDNIAFFVIIVVADFDTAFVACAYFVGIFFETLERGDSAFVNDFILAV